MWRMNRKGFTLVEIMIVVAIIGLLAAIAIPNFMKARAKALENARTANLKQIESAIQVYAIEQGADDTDAVTWALITPDYLRTNPSDTGTTYTVTTVGAVPTSS